MNLGSVTRSTQAYNALQDRLEQDPTAAKSKPSLKAAKTVEPKFSFDPFNKKSWDVKSKTAASEAEPTDGSNTKKGNCTGTGKVIPHAKFSFNPFDQKSWDVSAPKGSNVDAHV